MQWQCVLWKFALTMSKSLWGFQAVSIAARIGFLILLCRRPIDETLVGRFSHVFCLILFPKIGTPKILKVATLILDRYGCLDLRIWTLLTSHEVNPTNDEIETPSYKREWFRSGSPHWWCSFDLKPVKEIFHHEGHDQIGHLICRAVCWRGVPGIFGFAASEILQCGRTR